MNNVQIRSPFFPGNKTSQQAKTNAAEFSPELRRNSLERFKKLKDTTGNDAKVDIPTSVKEFARIKKAVDAAPQIDNSAKISNLKQQIQNGTYKMDYDAIAEKMLTQPY